MKSILLSFHMSYQIPSGICVPSDLVKLVSKNRSPGSIPLPEKSKRRPEAGTFGEMYVYAIHAIRNTQYAIRIRNTQYAIRIRNTDTQYAIRIRNTQFAIQIHNMLTICNTLPTASIRNTDTQYAICNAPTASIRIRNTYAIRRISAVRGVTKTLFSRERWREPGFARVPLTLAHLLLFHRRLDGCEHDSCASTRQDPMQIGANAERAAVHACWLHSKCDYLAIFSVTPRLTSRIPDGVQHTSIQNTDTQYAIRRTLNYCVLYVLYYIRY